MATWRVASVKRRSADNHISSRRELGRLRRIRRYSYGTFMPMVHVVYVLNPRSPWTLPLSKDPWPDSEMRTKCSERTFLYLTTKAISSGLKIRRIHS